MVDTAVQGHSIQLANAAGDGIARMEAIGKDPVTNTLHVSGRSMVSTADAGKTWKEQTQWDLESKSSGWVDLEYLAKR